MNRIEYVGIFMGMKCFTGTSIPRYPGVELWPHGSVPDELGCDEFVLEGFDTDPLEQYAG